MRFIFFMYLIGSVYSICLKSACLAATFRPFYLCENDICNQISNDSVICPSDIGLVETHLCKHERGHIGVITENNEDYRTVSCNSTLQYKELSTVYEAVYPPPYFGGVLLLRHLLHNFLSCELNIPVENVNVEFVSQNTSHTVYNIYLDETYANSSSLLIDVLRNRPFYERGLRELTELDRTPPNMEQTIESLFVETQTSVPPPAVEHEDYIDPSNYIPYTKNTWTLVGMSVGLTTAYVCSYYVYKYCNATYKVEPPYGARSPNITQFTQYMQHNVETIDLNKQD